MIGATLEDRTFALLAELRMLIGLSIRTEDRTVAAEQAAAAACAAFAPPMLLRPLLPDGNAPTLATRFVQPSQLAEKFSGAELKRARRRSEEFEKKCRPVLDAYGVTSLMRESDAIGDRLAEAEDRLTHTRATSIAGIHAKLAYAIGDLEKEGVEVSWGVAISCLADLAAKIEV